MQRLHTNKLHENTQMKANRPLASLFGCREGMSHAVCMLADNQSPEESNILAAVPSIALSRNRPAVFLFWKPRISERDMLVCLFLASNMVALSVKLSIEAPIMV